MGEGSAKDRWIASGACVVIAALCGIVAAWAAGGTGAAEQDVQRFGPTMAHRAARDAAGFGLVMMVISGVSGVACVGMLGLAVWIPLAGRRRRSPSLKRRRGS